MRFEEEGKLEVGDATVSIWREISTGKRHLEVFSSTGQGVSVDLTHRLVAWLLAGLER